MKGREGEPDGSPDCPPRASLNSANSPKATTGQTRVAEPPQALATVLELSDSIEEALAPVAMLRNDVSLLE